MDPQIRVTSFMAPKIRMALAFPLIGLAGLAGCSSAPKPFIPVPQMIGTHYSTRAQLEATADSLRSIIAAAGVSDDAGSPRVYRQQHLT